ncbi:MAG: hypothetical protein AB7O32_00170 [Vicinamibacterales bacterium]
MGISRSSTSVIDRPHLGEAVSVFTMAGLVGHFVLPFHPKANRAGKYSKFSAAHAAQRPDNRYAGRGQYNRLTLQTSNSDYDCVSRGLECELSDHDRADYMSMFDAEVEVASAPYRANWLRFESDVASAVEAAGATNTHAAGGGTPWSNNASGVPIDDLHQAKRTLLGLTGEEPRGLRISKQSQYDLSVSAQILAKLGSSNASKATIPVSVLAEVLDFDVILISHGYYNTANLGQAASMSPIWDADKAQVFYPTMSDARGYALGPIAKPQIGRTILWDAWGDPYNIEQYREDDAEQEVYRNKLSYDNEVFDTAFLYQISGVD